MMVSAEGGIETPVFLAGDREEKRQRSQFRESLVFLRDVVRDVFIAALAVYLVLLVLDVVKPGFASFFINMDILLALVLITGFLALIAIGTVKDEDTALLTEAPKPLALLGICALGIMGMVMIYFGTSATGTALFWSLIAGGLILIVLTMLLLSDTAKVNKRY